jgi:hypothetical protein
VLFAAAAPGLPWGAGLGAYAADLPPALAPDINLPPADSTYAESAEMRFYVNAASPDGGYLTYQWYRSAEQATAFGDNLTDANKTALRSEKVDIADIDGGKSATATPTSPTVSGTKYYYYWVEITNNKDINGDGDTTDTGEQATTESRFAKAKIVDRTLPVALVNGDFASTAGWGSTHYYTISNLYQGFEAANSLPTYAITNGERKSTGNNFIELSPYLSCSVFQEIATVPGKIYEWEVAYCRRGNGGGDPQVMAVVVGPAINEASDYSVDGMINRWNVGTSAAPAYTYRYGPNTDTYFNDIVDQLAKELTGSAESGRNYFIGGNSDGVRGGSGNSPNANKPYTTTYAGNKYYVYIVSSASTAFKLHSGSYTVPEGQGTTVFGFAAVSADGGAGHMLDDVSFASGSIGMPSQDMTYTGVTKLSIPTKAGYAYGLAEVRGSSTSTVLNAAAKYAATPGGAEAAVGTAPEYGFGGWYSTTNGSTGFAAGGVLTFYDLTPGKTYRIVGIPIGAISTALGTNQTPANVLDDGYYTDTTISSVSSGDATSIPSYDLEIYDSNMVRLTLNNTRADVQYALLTDSAGQPDASAVNPDWVWQSGAGGKAVFEGLAPSTAYHIVSRPLGYIEVSYAAAASGATKIVTPAGAQIDVLAADVSRAANGQSISLANTLYIYTYACVDIATGAIISSQGGNNGTLAFSSLDAAKTYRVACKPTDDESNYLVGVRVYPYADAFSIDYAGELIKSAASSYGFIPANVEYRVQAADASSTWVAGGAGAWVAGFGTAPVALGTADGILDKLHELGLDGNASAATASYRIKPGLDGYTGAYVAPAKELALPARPAAPALSTNYAIDYTAETFTPVTAIQSNYADAGVWASLTPATPIGFAALGWQGSGDYVVNVKKAAAGSAFASAVAAVAIVARPAPPSGLKAQLANPGDPSQGIILSGFESAQSYQYKRELESVWTALGAGLTASGTLPFGEEGAGNMGDYEVRFAPAAGNTAPASFSMVVSTPLNLTYVNFGSVAYGSAIADQDIVINNIIDENVRISNVSVDDTTHFSVIAPDLGQDADGNLVPKTEGMTLGQNSKYKLHAAQGLDAGVYQAVITATYTHNSKPYVIHANVYLTVTKIDWDLSALDATIDTSHTTAAALEMAVNFGSGPWPAGLLLATSTDGSTYSGATAATTRSFTSLSPASSYQIRGKASADTNHNESLPFVLATGYTAFATPAFGDIAQVNYLDEKLEFKSGIVPADYTVVATPAVGSASTLANQDSLSDLAQAGNFTLACRHNTDGQHPASQMSAPASITGKAAAPAGITTDKTTTSESADGKINLAGAFAYRSHSTGDVTLGWSHASGSATVTMGNYDVRYPGSSTAFASKLATVFVDTNEKHVTLHTKTFPDGGGTALPANVSVTGWTAALDAAGDYTHAYNTGNSPLGLPTPTSTSHDFLGWYGNADLSTGGAVTATPDESSSAVSDYAYYAKWAKRIASAAVTGIDAPTPGAGQDTAAVVDGAADYIVSAVSWYKDLDSSPALLGAGDTFLGGTDYRAAVTLTAKDADRRFVSGFAATIGGQAATADVSTVYPANAVTISYDYTTAAATVASIAVKTQPNLSYVSGNTLNLSALVVTLTHNDFTVKDVGFTDFAANSLAVSHASLDMASGATLLYKTTHDGAEATITYHAGAVTRTCTTGELSVGKGTPAPASPPSLSATYGDMLSAVGLSGGWVWDGAPASIPVGAVSASPVAHGATYTPTAGLGYPGGTDNYDTVQRNLDVAVSAKALAVTGLSFPSRAYDATVVAVRAAGDLGLSGVVDGDTVSIANHDAAFSFANANVGVNKDVTAGAAYTLTGADAGNYTVTPPTNLKGTVTVATPSFGAAPTAAAITYGQTLADAALSGGAITGAGADGDITSAGTLAFVSPTAVPEVTSGSPLSYTVRFTPSSSNYAYVECEVSVTVGKATPTVATAPTGSTIEPYVASGDDTLADSAITGGSVTYLLSGTAAGVAGSWAWDTTDSGTNTALASGYSTNGAYTPRAIFTPTDTTRFNTATSAVSVLVNSPASRVMIAPTAPSVTYGQTLSSISLDTSSAKAITKGDAAETPLAGDWSWTDGDSQVLPLGPNTVSVTFTPTGSDSANHPTTCNVSVTVVAANPGAPTALGAAPGNASVALSWTAPAFTGGVAIDCYIIEYSTDSSFSSFTTQNTDSAATSYTIGAVGSSTLANGTQYYFRVKAHNSEDGVSVASSSANATPAKATPTLHTSAQAIAYGTALGDIDISGFTATVGAGSDSGEVAGVWAWAADGSTIPTSTAGASYTLDFTPTGTDYYNATSASITVTVTPAVITGFTAISDVSGGFVGTITSGYESVSVEATLLAGHASVTAAWGASQPVNLPVTAWANTAGNYSTTQAGGYVFAPDLTVPAYFSLPGALEKQPTITVNIATQPTWGVSLSDDGDPLGSGAYGFDGDTYGYAAAPAALSVTIANTGNQPTETLAVSSSSADFAVTPASVASIAQNAETEDAFTVQPVTGLSAGTHTATITVLGDVSAGQAINGVPQSFSETFDVSFEVEKAVIADVGATVTAPSKAAAISDAAAPAGATYTVTGYVSWKLGNDPVALPDTFLGGSAYTATVVLAPASANYAFGTDPDTHTINGETAEVSNASATSLTLSYTFDATDERVISALGKTADIATLGYSAGDTLDLSGLAVDIAYDDGTADTATYGQFAAKGISVNYSHGDTLYKDTHDGQSVLLTGGLVTAGTAVDAGTLSVGLDTAPLQDAVNATPAAVGGMAAADPAAENYPAGVYGALADAYAAAVNKLADGHATTAELAAARAALADAHAAAVHDHPELSRSHAKVTDKGVALTLRIKGYFGSLTGVRFGADSFALAPDGAGGYDLMNGSAKVGTAAAGSVAITLEPALLDTLADGSSHQLYLTFADTLASGTGTATVEVSRPIEPTPPPAPPSGGSSAQPTAPPSSVTPAPSAPAASAKPAAEDGDGIDGESTQESAVGNGAGIGADAGPDTAADAGSADAGVGAPDAAAGGADPAKPDEGAGAGARPLLIIVPVIVAIALILLLLAALRRRKREAERQE